jgi:hypothetical protein
MTVTPYRHFHCQTWPVPCTELDSIVYKLRYIGPDHVFSMEDRLILVSVVNAYGALISKSQDARNSIIRELRKGPNR